MTDGLDLGVQAHAAPPHSHIHTANVGKGRSLWEGEGHEQRVQILQEPALVSR